MVLLERSQEMNAVAGRRSPPCVASTVREALLVVKMRIGGLALRGFFMSDTV